MNVPGKPLFYKKFIPFFFVICLFGSIWTFSSIHPRRSFVTCTLGGQLGNQMFQIAAAVAYALDHDCEARFPKICQAADGKANVEFVFHRLNQEKFPKKTRFKIYRENESTHYTVYRPIPHQKNKNLCLSGFFQTEKYFAHHAKAIKALFAPSPETRALIEKRYGKILSQPTVAIHVRTFSPDGRLPGDPSFCGGASWEYYLEAMSRFSADHTFLVFSDAIEWTKKNFPKTAHKIEFIEGNPHYLDLYLMSFCDHQIISPESTFSWWAAWLNSNPNKIVICPESWAGRKDADTMAYSWIQLPLKSSSSTGFP